MKYVFFPKVVTTCFIEKVNNSATTEPSERLDNTVHTISFGIMLSQRLANSIGCGIKLLEYGIPGR
jgi:hypothetical protein